MRLERKVRGRKGSIPYRGLEYFGLSINHIKQWREREYDQGRPSGLEDFYAVHGLCFDCGSTGVREIGYSHPSESETEAANELGREQLPVYGVCATCGGTGKADRAKWVVRLKPETDKS